MGTRGAIGFRYEDQDYITYNHFDSYPSYLAVRICEQIEQMHIEGGANWLKDIKGNKNTLKARVRNIKLVNNDDKPSNEDIKALIDYADESVSTGNLRDFYVLTRNMQGDLLANLKTGYMIDNENFLGDSLFCEWAYIINLDSDSLEVYKGFNHNPDAAGRYASLCEDDADYGLEKYYGVELIKTISLTEIAEDTTDFGEEYWDSFEKEIYEAED